MEESSWSITKLYQRTRFFSQWERSTLYMMKMIIMINCFSEMFEQQKGFSLIYSRDHCPRSLLSRISHTPRARFETAVSLILGLVEWSCEEVILTILLENLVKILQLRISFQISMVSCSTFIMDHKVQFRWTSYIQCFHHESSTPEHDTTHKNLNFAKKYTTGHERDLTL